MSGALQLLTTCNRTAFAVLNQPQLVYLHIELRPGAAIANARMPLNFALLLDCSGSMAGAKLKNMKAAVKNIIDQLEPTDILSILTFDDQTKVLAPTQAAQDKNDLKRKVDSIKDGGSTRLALGLREALAQVSRHNLPDRASRIILLTDGDTTDNEDDSRREAENAGARGIPIIGLGFGTDWKEDFIYDLADRAIFAPPGSHSGQVYFINQPREADKIFQEVYQSMQVVARNAQVIARMVQGVEARRVWRVMPMISDIGLGSIQGRAVVIPVGDLEKGGASYLIELMMPPRPEGNVRIAQTEVTFEVPGQGPQREAGDLVVTFTTDPALAAQLNGQVMNVVERVTAFKLQTQALDEAQLGNVKGATQKLRQAVTILLSQGEAEQAAQLQREADNLEGGKDISAEGRKTIKLTSRKTRRLTDTD
jgi:Ca-activated chloride channel family protein